MKNNLTGQVHSKKKDPGDAKSIYFYIWYHNRYMHYIKCIKRFDIKNAQHQVYNAFVHQKLVLFRAYISVDLI